MLPARENFRSSELAPLMTTTLSFIPGMKFCLLPSTFHFHISQRLARAARGFRSLSTVDDQPFDHVTAQTECVATIFERRRQMLLYE